MAYFHIKHQLVEKLKIGGHRRATDSGRTAPQALAQDSGLGTPPRPEQEPAELAHAYSSVAVNDRHGLSLRDGCAPFFNCED
jgi:hypothetical protein